MRGGWVLCICAAAIVFSPPASGQTAYGSITGSVRDAVTQAPLPATVRYANLSSGTNGVTATREGLFTFSSLSPGTYRVSVSEDGYQDRLIEQLELPVAGHLEVRFDLWKLSDPWHSGAYSSVVMPGSQAVTAYYGPDIDTSRSDTFQPVDVNTSRLETAVSTVIGSHDISDLPLAGRDVFTLLVLLPGVTADTTTARGLGFSVAGQRPSSSNYLLDGLENNDMVITGPLGVLAPESVQEYRISIDGFSAEYGRTSGFLANAITRAGTSVWHGLGYVYVKNDRLNANGFQENLGGIARAPLKEWQPGFFVSGPLVGSRLFASSSLEFRRFRSLNDPQIYALPTAQFIASTDPASVAGKLLRQYPASAVPAGPGDAGLVSIAAPAALDQVLALARLDYVSPAAAHHLFARISVSRERNPDLLFNPYPQFSSPYHQGAVSLAAGWNWQVTPGTTHEVRIGRTGNAARYDRPHAEVPQLADGQARLADGPDSYAVTLPGSASSLSYRSIARNWEVVDNWGWSRGRHSFRFGGGALWRTVDSAFTADLGDYLFANLAGFAADSPVDLVVAYDRQAAGYRSVPYNRTYNYSQVDGFFQDAFRATARLTLSLGLRYDFYRPPLNTGPAKESLLQLGPGATFPARLSNAQYLQPTTGNQQLFDSDKRDWAPRAGISYDLTGSGRTVLRASYGIFYDRPFDNLWQIVSINRQIAGGWFFDGPVNFLAPPLSLANQGQLGLSSQFHTPLLFQPGLRNPMVQNSFAGVERKLTDGITLDVNALAARGRRLWSTDIVNRFGSLPEDQANPSGRYNPNLQEIDYRGNQGQSDYFALSSALHFHGSRWNGQVTYTWSHAIDNQSDPLAGAFEDYNQERQANRPDYTALAGFTRQFDSGADRANADFDQRQNLVFYGIYEAPAALQSTALRMLFRDWRVSALGAIRSGLPFTVYAPANDTGAGAFLLNQRADLVSNASASAAAQQLQGGKFLLNSAAFALPAADTVGTSGRNAFTGPGLISADLSVARRFPVGILGEAGRLTLRADFYNAFNHANLNNPQSYLTGARFGQALFGRREQNSGFPVLAPLNETARQIQLLLRVEF